MGSKFLDCVTVFTYGLKSAKLWEIIHKFVMEGESATAKKKPNNQPLYSQGYNFNMPCIFV